ncbi:hypothetical protein [Cardiobacterium valvarum]|nr:hypothetical protein [Cardiobacterium valvarum]
MRAPFSVVKRKTHTQKLSCFLKNPVISIEKPSAALIPCARDNISRHAAKHIPVAHDWSKNGVEHKNKIDTLSPPYDRGYELQSISAINAADEQPPAVLAQNPVTKDTVHRSYGHSDKMLHLDCAWRTLPRKITPRKNRALSIIIDREADSVYHLCEWNAAGHPFLVRMRGYSGVTRDGKTYKAQELEREPSTKTCITRANRWRWKWRGRKLY